MARKANNSNLGELALGTLTVKQEKEKLRALIKAKEAALDKKTRSMKEKFNIARVSATMNVALTVFSALGVNMYTSLQAALKVPGNVEKLNKAGNFDCLFEDEKALLIGIAGFLNQREDVRLEILEFLEKEKEHIKSMKAANVKDDVTAASEVDK